MKIGDIVRCLLVKRGHSQRSYASTVGVAVGAVASLLNKSNPHTDTLLKYLAPLGYTVAIVPVGSRLPDDAYVVTPSCEPEPAPYDLDDPDLLIG